MLLIYYIYIYIYVEICDVHSNGCSYLPNLLLAYFTHNYIIANHVYFSLSRDILLYVILLYLLVKKCSLSESTLLLFVLSIIINFNFFNIFNVDC